MWLVSAVPAGLLLIGLYLVLKGNKKTRSSDQILKIIGGVLSLGMLYILYSNAGVKLVVYALIFALGAIFVLKKLKIFKK